MQRILADTNILLRGVEPDHPSHHIADNATFTLAKRGDIICILPQNIFEFWNVCTRPANQNGFGWSVERTDREVSRLEKVFEILPDSHAIYTEWRDIVRDHAVLGKQVHDARIAAAMRVHQIRKLLTFNARHFKRFDDIEIINPDFAIGSDA